MMHLIRYFIILLSLYCISIAQEVRNGNLFTLITDIRTAMPGSGSYGFIVPTTAQQDSFAVIVNLVLSEQYYLADSLAEYLNYTLFEWYDTANNNHLYYVLMENNADVPAGVQYGWGTYILNPTGYQEVIIEVPHPIWDTNTWQVGFKAYQYLNSKYFLMAGTHRYANGSNPAPADVAHNTQNVFHTVHQNVSPFSTHTLQVHGFSIDNHPGYPDVVLSNGSADPTPILDSLSNEIINQGYSVGIYDGVNWSQLGATTNTQGQWSRGQGYSFIHMELEYFIRYFQSEFENILDALYNVFLIPLAIEQDYKPITPSIFTLEQNYPNPFNSNTTFTFFLPKSSPIQMIIYNVLGENLWQLNLDLLPAGHHQYQFDSGMLRDNSLSGGVYFLTVYDSQSKQCIKLTYLP